MYCEYFGFDEMPFSVTPDPRFDYNSAISEDVLNRLRYGIEGRKGFILVTGEAGTGKTTLLRRVMRSFPDRVDFAYSFNPRLKFPALLRAMLKDLGISATSKDKESMLEQLNSYVLQQHAQGRIVSCIFDEAQGLSESVLEDLRLLGNLETDREKLIQIVLVGQPELESRLDTPNLHQMKQRISQRIVLHPLRLDEIGAYLAARLSQAGYRGKALFDAAAAERIGRYSRGIPRLINTICDNALVRAWQNEMQQVTGELVDESAIGLCLFQVSQGVEPPPSPLICTKKFPQDLPDKTNRAETARDSVTDTVAESEAKFPPAISKIRRALADLISHVKQERFAFTTLAACFVLVLGSLALSMLGPQGEAQYLKVSRIESHGHAPVITVVPPLPAALPVQSGETVRSPHSGVPPLSLITQTQNRGKESADVGTQRQPEVVHVRDVNRPMTRTVFRVSEASFLRNKPSANADVITTLRPGIRVEVIAAGGEYFTVHALGAEDIYGFVHKEDAFFEPVR